MFFILYKITNKVDNKIYIGKHKTSDLDDGYMGSGKLLKHAIKKHGILSFEKEVLFYCSDEASLNKKEAEIVNEEFCTRTDTYNICAGGNGGWGFVNTHKLTPYHTQPKHWNKIKDKISKTLRGRTLPKISEGLRKSYSEGRKKISGCFTGDSLKEMTKRAQSPEANKKRSESLKKYTGPKNSQFGSFWITDGESNKKVKSDFCIPIGWNKGRTISRKNDTGQ